jgi:hypothetical protein
VYQGQGFDVLTLGNQSKKALKQNVFERFFVPASIIKGSGGAVSSLI